MDKPRFATISAYAGQERKKAVGSSDIVDFSGTSGIGYGRNQENARKEKLNSRFSVLGKKKDAQAANGNGETDQVEKGSLARTRDTGRTSRLDGKGPAFQENEDDQAVNGNSAGSSSKKTVERPIIIEAQFKMSGILDRKIQEQAEKYRQVRRSLPRVSII